MIILERLSYSYPNSGIPALKDISLEINDGDFILVVGPSGAGKSTLLRCLNGLIPHFYGGSIRGSVNVMGRFPIRETPKGMSDLVGFVFQDPESQFVAEEVEDELAFALENHNFSMPIMRKRVEEVIDQLGITHLRNRRISQLSGGERQKVAIGSALTLQPKILVLDEPTSQLDPQAAEEVLTILQKLNRDLGITVILSEHRLERVVEYCDRLCYLPGDAGPIIVGEPREVLGKIPLVPPLTQLAKALKWEPLPLTLKEARQQIRHFPPIYKTQVAKLRSEVTLLRIKSLHFSYNGKEALKGVSLDLCQGELVALMGRNGSGKSTLLKNIVGLLQPASGEISITGLPAGRRKLEEVTRLIGFVPQNPNRLLFAETLEDELNFTRSGHHLPPGDYDALLNQLGLINYRLAYPRDLSVGERQRAALASILVGEPEILLLDEPTRGLDYAAKESLRTILLDLKAQGKSIIMATHDVELVARTADRVAIMAEGEIVVEGNSREVMTQSMIFSTQINKLFRQPSYLTVEDVIERSCAL